MLEQGLEHMSTTASAESFGGGLTEPFAEAIDAVQIDDVVAGTDISISPAPTEVADEPPSGIHDPVFPVVVIGAISLLAILIIAAFLAL